MFLIIHLQKAELEINHSHGDGAQLSPSVTSTSKHVRVGGYCKITDSWAISTTLTRCHKITGLIATNKPYTRTISKLYRTAVLSAGERWPQLPSVQGTSQKQASQHRRWQGPSPVVDASSSAPANILMTYSGLLPNVMSTTCLLG